MAFSLACDDGATPTILRIEGEDDNVTWNDVWEYGVGSGNGVVTGDANGDAVVSDFITEHVTDAMYWILKNIQFGDGTNALTFYSKNEIVYFEDQERFTIKDYAILQLGELSGDYSVNGSHWDYRMEGDIIAAGNPNAAFKVYGSSVYFRIDVADSYRLEDGTVDFRNSMFYGINPVANIIFGSGIDSLILKNLYLNSFYTVTLKMSPDVMESVWLHNTKDGLYFFEDITFEDALVTGADSYKLKITIFPAGKVVNLINPRWVPIQSEILIGSSTGALYVKFACDIHAVDKDGANLQGVTILCEDKDNNEVFNVQTGASGEIAQQTITYKKWYGSSETETEYSPHKFTLSKAGYKTLIYEAVTVNGKIDWHIELQLQEAGAGRSFGRGMV